MRRSADEFNAASAATDYKTYSHLLHPYPMVIKSHTIARKRAVQQRNAIHT
jgi:hypothetical protein